jgi:hypothetical protein
MWIASGKRSSKKMLSDPQKRMLNQVWGRAYKDSRLFKQTRIAITQTEIGKILAVWVAGGIEKNGVLCEAGGVAIVPVDPTKVLSASNSAIVATSTRSVLMKRWKHLGKAEYCKLLEGSNELEEL